jgi:hypothetical protein
MNTENNAPRKHKRYDESFKRSAVELWLQGGKPVQAAEIAARSGWDSLTAVREQRIQEISGEDILQPGFRLVYGYEQMQRLLAANGLTTS